MNKSERLPSETLIAADQSIKERNYWRKKLSGELVKCIFPYDFIPSKARERKLAALSFSWGGELFSKLSWVINGSDHRLQMVLVTALSLLVQKYSGNRDIILGTPIYKQEQESNFINTLLPLRNRVEGHLTFKELLFGVRQTLVEAVENQNYPLNALLNDLNLSGEEDDFPLFDMIILLENLQDKSYCQPVEPNLLFSFLREEASLRMSIEYNTALYREETQEKIAAHLTQLLKRVLFDTGIRLSEVDIVSEDERRQLVEEFNDTAVDYPLEKTLQEFLVEQGEKAPDQVAAVCERYHLTYRELNRRSWQLAAVLRDAGLEPGTVAAIMVERSVEMLIAMFGILSAGSAYLPIATGYPADRVTYILQDSRVRFLLTHDRYGQPFGDLCETLDIFSLINSRPIEGLSGKSGDIPSPRDLAYVIYTSGSTGKPKGVIMEHRPVLNLVYGLRDAIYREYPGERLRVALIAPYEFDASVQQIFGALLLGHTLYIVPDETKLDSSRLLKYYKKHRIHITDGTPTHLRLLLESLAGNARGLSLRHFIIAGEVLPKKVAADLLSQFDDPVPGLTNLYGPTETCVDSTFYKVTAGNLEQLSTIPIGKPLPNERLYILNSEAQLQPSSVAGELVIGGSGLARGYLNNPELTFEKFDHNKTLLRGVQGGGFLEKSPPGRRRQKLYRSGDLARWLPDGNIEFIGRIDHQIKLRGYRIELGEIETLLLKHPEIKEAVVKVTESNGNKKLCAYVVSDSELTVTQLREYLSRDLPRQMIPDYFLRLEQIPLKPNRKVDLKALDVIGRQLGTGVEYLEPGNEIEEILAGIWTGVLGLSRVSVNDSFFEIGGNSLSIVTVSSRLKQALGRDIALVDLFRFPTIRSLAQFLDLSAAHSGEEVPAPVEERVEVERRGLDKLQNLKKRARELS